MKEAKQSIKEFLKKFNNIIFLCNLCFVFGAVKFFIKA